MLYGFGAPPISPQPPGELYRGIEDTIYICDKFINTACEYFRALKPEVTKRELITPEEETALMYLKNKIEVFREADIKETEIIRAVLEEIGYILGIREEWSPWIAKVYIKCSNPKCNYSYKINITDYRKFFDLIRGIRSRLRGECPQCGAPLENLSKIESRQYFAFPKELHMAIVECKQCGDRTIIKASSEKGLEAKLKVINKCPRGHNNISIVEKKSVKTPWELTQREMAIWGILYIPPGKEVPPPERHERKVKIYRVANPRDVLRIPRILLSADRRYRLKEIIERMLDNLDNEVVLSTLASKFFKQLNSLRNILLEDRSRVLQTPKQVVVNGDDLLIFVMIGLRIWSATEFQLRAYVKDIDIKAGHIFFPIVGNFRGALEKFGRRLLQKWSKKILFSYEEIKKFFFDIIAGANMIRELLRAIRTWIPDQQAIIQYRRQQMSEAMRTFFTIVSGGAGGSMPFIPLSVQREAIVPKEERETMKKKILEEARKEIEKLKEKKKEE